MLLFVFFFFFFSSSYSLGVFQHWLTDSKIRIVASSVFDDWFTVTIALDFQLLVPCCSSLSIPFTTIFKKKKKKPPHTHTHHTLWNAAWRQTLEKMSVRYLRIRSNASIKFWRECKISHPKGTISKKTMNNEEMCNVLFKMWVMKRNWR